jgi:glycosyltransferase involved in cell wall biosynthesis
MNFKASIIISAFNSENYIKTTIQSALEQTYANLEIIVINDGSTDDTLGILEHYSDKIKIINQTNQGQDAALNYGFIH